jgi:hypothetical protein
VKILPDPLYLRVLSGCAFAAAFVWVAISYFDVDPQVVKVFAILCVLFVGGLMVLGLVFSFVLRLVRRNRHDGGLLDSIAAGTVDEASVLTQVEDGRQASAKDPKDQAQKKAQPPQN